MVTKNFTAEYCEEPVRDKTQQYIDVSNTLGVLSGIFVVQRFAFKYWARLEFGLDDWFCLATIVGGVPDTIMNTYGLGRNGLGRDAWTVPFERLTKFGLFFYFMELTYFIEVVMVKLTLLFFYMRIFPTGRVRQLLWATVAFTVVYGVAFVITSVFQCQPISHYWLKWDGQHNGRCLDMNAFGWSNAAISIALDGWMLFLPLWQLKKLNLDWKRKVGVALMFCLGTL